MQASDKMSKRVILVTGTPCVGKTSAARALTSKLDALYLNLTDLAMHENLVLGKDEERNSTIVDEKRMKKRIDEIIKKTDKENIVVDGHYAVNIVPLRLITSVFVLRRDPVELRKLMEQSGFSGRKLFENLASEILDVCLVDALNMVDQRKVCELNVTGKSVEETVQEILHLLNNPHDCQVGIVDWLGKLESEGLLDDYLKT
jgi:broad-specificity NMP kinase